MRVSGSEDSSQSHPRGFLRPSASHFISLISGTLSWSCPEMLCYLTHCGSSINEFPVFFSGNLHFMARWASVVFHLQIQLSLLLTPHQKGYSYLRIPKQALPVWQNPELHKIGSCFVPGVLFMCFVGFFVDKTGTHLGKALQGPVLSLCLSLPA